MFGRRKRELVPDDSGWLHVLREAACPGPSEVHLQVDGMDVARLGKGKHTSVRLAPGEHIVHIRPWAGNWSSWYPLEQSLMFHPAEEREFTIRCENGGFLKKNTIKLHERPWRNQVRQGRQPAGKPAVDWSRHTFDVVETGLVQEPAGQTSFVEDNTGSAISSSGTTRVENEWTRTIVIGGASTQTTGIAARLHVGWTASSHGSRRR